MKFKLLNKPSVHEIYIQAIATLEVLFVQPFVYIPLKSY